MTAPIRTKCPQCSACFNLPETLLHEITAKARCSRCETIFSVNEHLIVSANSSSSIISAVAQHNNKLHKQVVANAKGATDCHTKEDTLIADLSIDTITYDDIQINEDQDSNVYFDDTNEQANWFEKLKALSNKDYCESRLHESVADNTIPNADNGSWIASVLQEKKDDLHSFDSDISVSHLLTDTDSPTTNQERLNRDQQYREQIAGREIHPSIAVLIWSAGCLVLIMLLFAQYVIFNLDTLVKNPTYAARLQAVCSIAACSLPNADLTSFTVTKLSYRSSVVNADHTFSDIQANLVNNGLQSQLLPNLKVSVYSTDTLVGEFIALPKDYLLSAQSQIAAEHHKPVMFTVPVTADQISQVIIHPIY